MWVLSLDAGTRNLAMYIEDVSLNKGVWMDLFDCHHDWYQLRSYLLFHYHLFKMCSVFILERQLYKSNPSAQAIASFCYAFFFILYGDKASVYWESSRNKTKLLGYTISEKDKKELSSNKQKSKRKKWVVYKALEILISRGDTELVRQLLQEPKQDDLADTICQLLAWRIKRNKI
jgi:hypothetical protein